MPLRWQIFRIICVLQTVLTAAAFLFAMINLRFGSVTSLTRLLIYGLALSLAINGMNILHRNYPDTKIEGSQKSWFNRIYLINVIGVAFLFAFLFADIRLLQDFKKQFGQYTDYVPVGYYWSISLHVLLLLFQFYILYGLYGLRMELFMNSRKEQFEFESGNV